MKQLKKDHNILENIIAYKRLIYIGFVGVGKKNKYLKAKLKKMKDLDLVILQIKQCHWLKRNLTQNIDWETYSKFKNENALLKREIDSLNKKCDILFDIVKNSIGIKNTQFLGIKRGREWTIKYLTVYLSTKRKYVRKNIFEKIKNKYNYIKIYY